MSHFIKSTKAIRLPVVEHLQVLTRNQHWNPPFVHPNPLVQPRSSKVKTKSKHANPRFTEERRKKVFKIQLPDFHEKKLEDMTAEEIKTKMKKLGVQISRPWSEKPLYISATSGVFESYIPPEGDQKAFLLSAERVKQTGEFLTKKGKSWRAVRKIQNYDEDFVTTVFAKEALKIYKNMHEALVNFDEDELHKWVTEFGYPKVVNEVKKKTLRWGFHGCLDEPKCVQVRQTSALQEDNIFAQITVRFHTQQTLAVYDRFGRLLHGSETVLRDVLEYIVFEKHLSNVYGTWRIHDKIVPPWMKLPPTSKLTFKFEEYEMEKTEPETSEVSTMEVVPKDDNQPTQPTPALA